MRGAARLAVRHPENDRRADEAAAATAPRTAPISTTPLAPSRPARHSRAHSQAITPPAIAVTIGNQGQPNHAMAIAIGARTSAESVRSLSEPWEPCSAGANRGTVTALATAVIGDRLFEIAAPEIRPQRLGEDQFGVGALP